MTYGTQMGSHILKDLTHKMKGQHPPPKKKGGWSLGSRKVYKYKYKYMYTSMVKDIELTRIVTSLKL